jgi:TolB protein
LPPAPSSFFVARLARVAVALLIAWCVASPARAAGFMITVEPGGSDLPLAVPKPVAPQGDAFGDVDVVWSILLRDLEMTGYFDLIDPKAYIDSSGGVEPGSFKFADWKAIKATALAKTRIQPRGNDIQLDVFVYDVNSGERIAARGFVGKPQDVRNLAHRAADAIVVALTGRPSFFGSQLAVVGSRGANKEIYVMDIDGESVRPVTRNGSINLSPAWSPDGRRVAWTSYKRGNPDVYVKDLVSGQTSVLSSRQGINTGAAYSPDGALIALARSIDADAEIFLIDAVTGADKQRVTFGGGIDVSPTWSPDGRYLAFSSERSGGSQIYLHDTQTGESKRVSFVGGFNTDPVWSPDGTRIAYVTREGNFDIIVAGIDGSGAIRVTQDQGDNEDPCWSPDGRYLVFSSTRRGKEEIWLSTADGRHQVVLTDGSAGWTQPTWQPPTP